MSFFDPHHVYDKKKSKSHKGQIIQKRIGPELIPPMSNYELARMRNYLVSNGMLTEERKYAMTLHRVYKESSFTVPRTGYVIFHFQPIYNDLFRTSFEWKVPPTGQALPKKFEVMVSVTRIEYLYKTEIGTANEGTVSYIPNRTNPLTLTKTQLSVNRHATYTPQDVSFCQLQYPGGSQYPNYLVIDAYSNLISYHSYDLNDYTKFALGSDLPIDELFALGMTQYALANTADLEIELFVTINYTY